MFYAHHCESHKVPFVHRVLTSSSFVAPFFLSQPIPKQSCPAYILDGANPTCAFIMYDGWDQPLCSSLLKIATTSYSSCTDMFLCRQYRIWPVRPFALHTLSAIISDKKGSCVCFQIILAALAVLVQNPSNVSSSFLLSLNRRFMALVFHPLILSKMAPLQDQFFTSGTEDAVYLFHHSFSCHSPWYVFASVDFHISPPGLVRTLHPLLQAVPRFLSGLIGSVSQNLELICSNGSLCGPLHVLISMSSIISSA